MRLLAVCLLTVLAYLTSFTSARPWNTSDPCPNEIKTVVSEEPCYRYSSCSAEPRFTNLDALHSALSTCPNITALDLRITGLGCSSWPARWNLPFDFAGGEKYPRLKSLRLEGYRFGGDERENWHFPENRYGNLERVGDIGAWIIRGHWKTWWKWKSLPEEQQVKTNFALWLDAMDWSGIEHLWIESMNDEIVEKLPSRLQSLHTLETNNITFIEALRNNTLKNLTWTGFACDKVQQAILSSHGPSLQALDIHCPELTCSSWIHEFNATDYRIHAPNLTHLSINLARNGTWPLKQLEEIASLESLTHLDLWLNLRSECRRQYPESYSRDWDQVRQDKGYCQGEDQYQRPFLDDHGAMHVFEHLQRHKKGKALVKTTFWVGDWTRGWDGPLYSPDWLEGRRAQAVCEAGQEHGVQAVCGMEAGDGYWESKGENVWDYY